jgi:hypothetical protein
VRFTSSQNRENSLITTLTGGQWGWFVRFF